MHPWISSQIATEIEQVLRLAPEADQLLSLKSAEPCFSLGIKTSLKNRFGELEQVLLFAQTGWEDGKIPPPQGWACLRLLQVQQIISLEDLHSAELAGLIDDSSCSSTSLPKASPFVLLHAAHPARFTCFSQPQAVLAGKCIQLTSLPFDADLPRLCRSIEPLSRENSMLVLAYRGLLVGAETLSDCLAVPGKAELDLLEPVSPVRPYADAPDAVQLLDCFSIMPELRFELGAARGRPQILHLDDSLEMKRFAASLSGEAVAKTGLPYPEFFTRTGIPLSLPCEEYDFLHLSEECPAGITTILHPDLGVITAGDSPAEAQRASKVFHAGAVAVEIGLNTPAFQLPNPDEVRSASDWEGFSRPARLPFSGEVALVTGSASGIGKAVAASLLARGSAVVGLDINPAIQTTFDHPSYYGIQCDVSNEESICGCLKTVVELFGGLDMLILNAGLFPGGCNISKMRTDEFMKVINVNFTANMLIMRDAYPLLSKAPRYGRVVMIGSKNFRAPGPGAAAYSTSKAALTQLARVAALEWAGDRIRVNVIHPDSVFDTALYTPEVLQSRASHYGMTVEQYKKRNLLKTEITSHDVAEMVAEMCGPLFYHMTGGQIQFDGGNDRTL